MMMMMLKTSEKKIDCIIHTHRSLKCQKKISQWIICCLVYDCKVFFYKLVDNVFFMLCFYDDNIKDDDDDNVIFNPPPPPPTTTAKIQLNFN